VRLQFLVETMARDEVSLICPTAEHSFQARGAAIKRLRELRTAGFDVRRSCREPAVITAIDELVMHT